MDQSGSTDAPGEGGRAPRPVPSRLGGPGPRRTAHEARKRAAEPALVSWTGDDDHSQRLGYSGVDRDRITTAVHAGSANAVPGPNRQGRVPLAEARRLATAEWRAASERGEVNPKTVAFETANLGRLLGYAAAVGATTLADVDGPMARDWVVAPGVDGQDVSGSTFAGRRATVRLAWRTFRVLGLDDRAVGQDIVLPRHSDKYVKPLLAEHIPLVRHAAEGTRWSARKAVVELALAGVTGAEMPAVAVHHLFLDQRRVFVPGVPKRTAPRWAAVYDDYSVQVLTDHLEWMRRRPRFRDGMPGDTPVVYRISVTRVHHDDRKTSSNEVILGRLLRAAGLQALGYRAQSFREYLAITVWERTGKIEAVAATLGLNSLDTASLILRVSLGRRWRDQYGVTGPDDRLAALVGADWTGELVTEARLTGSASSDGLGHDGTTRLDLYRQAQAAALADHALHRHLQAGQYRPDVPPDRP